MTRVLLLAGMFVFALAAGSDAQQSNAAPRVLVVTDARPVMETLVAGLSTAQKIAGDIVSPMTEPPAFAGYRGIIVSMSDAMPNVWVMALKSYASSGGRLILLHRSISPQQPAEWLSFVGVTFAGSDTGGGFRAVANASVELAALTHRSPVIETNVVFDRAVVYRSTSRPREQRLPGLGFAQTTALLGQTQTRLKRQLMGIKVTDPRSNMAYIEDTAVWVEELENGFIYYFVLGRSSTDFQVPSYVQMIANAVVLQ